MPQNLARQLIGEHLVDGRMEPGEEIALRMDQTLTQDATGTLVMLEFEALQVERVKTKISVQYVDHNLIQEDHRNPDDHLFLETACRKYGLWYSPAGNGVSHPVHQERFGIPGQSMVGSDSHTPAAGAIAMLAFGSGGLEVALAMAGRPLHLKMPRVMGIELRGRLSPWVSAKDVVLELLRRYGVKGARGCIIEYFGDGLESLSAMDRHVIANMGTELGATTSVFPSDAVTRQFFRQQEREEDWRERQAESGARYDHRDWVDLPALEPLIATPGSPGNVTTVHDVAGKALSQAYIGSSANPGFRDFALPALMVEGRRVDSRVSFDVNPTSRQILENLTEAGYLGKLIHAGARIHQAGCNGCIGMGQAPATRSNSLRTVPRNFPGRSGSEDDRVYLCSPETVTASALTGFITDPRDLGMDYPGFQEPEKIIINREMLVPPPADGATVDLRKGPNIATFPDLDPLPDPLEGPVLLKVGDDVSTDEILPAGNRVLPLRSNLPEISKYCFTALDPSFHYRAREREGRPFFVIGGDNYGQGSSREHAALAPRHLGMRCVVAKSFARIHWQNLVNFGVLPLVFKNVDDFDALESGHFLRFSGGTRHLLQGHSLHLESDEGGDPVPVVHELSERQIRIIEAGGLVNYVRHSEEAMA